MVTSHEIEIRVRYQETDAQGRLHHANYFTYFEVGRTELLRAAGYSYRKLEAQGVYLVVAEIGCEYFLPASYDDLLRLRTTTTSARGARLQHQYDLMRDGELLARGHSTLACVTREGRAARLPSFLREASDSNDA